MRSYFKAAALIVCTILALPSAAAAAKKSTKKHFKENIKKVVGTAKDRQGTLLYTEHHENFYLDSKLQKRRSEYFDPTGKLIAKIDTDFSHSLCLPNYTFSNFEADSEEILHVEQGSIVAKYRPPRKKNFFEKTFPDELNVCSGFGVNEWIASQLPTLEKNDHVQMKFLPIPRLSIYSMLATVVQEKEYAEPHFISINFELDSPLLKFFIPSALFVFDKRDKTTVFYRGPSNLVNKFGSRANVWVTYRTAIQGKDKNNEM